MPKKEEEEEDDNGPPLPPPRAGGRNRGGPSAPTPGCAAMHGDERTNGVLMDGVIDSGAGRRWRNPRLDRFIAVWGEGPSAFISGGSPPFHFKREREGSVVLPPPRPPTPNKKKEEESSICFMLPRVRGDL